LSAPHCGSLRSGRTRGTHPGHAKSPGITRRGSWRRFGLQRGSLPDGPDLEPKISAQTHMVCELPHNPSKKGACTGRAGRVPLISEAVEFGGVIADALFARAGGQVAELALDVLLRVRPDAVGVWEVRAPHDVVLAKLVEQFHADWVALVGRVALPAPVFAR